MTRKQPKYRQIMNEITAKIKSGEFPSSSRLPSERVLAKQLSVNRSTVIRSYEELTSLGILKRKRGSGTYVSSDYNPISIGQTNWYQMISAQHFTKKHYYQNKIENNKYGAMDLYTGELSSDLIPNFNFPAFDWANIAQKNQDTSGLIDLKLAVCQHLAQQNIQVTPEEVLITSGARQALFLLLQVLLSPGDAVAIENPSFLHDLPLFQTAGVKAIKIPLNLENESIDLLQLEEQLHKIKLLILNPNFHNPTGMTLSLANRKKLIALCQSYQVPIIEDDVFQLFNFSRQKIQTLKSLDTKNVIYLGSLSKLLGKNINIGWCVAPDFIVNKLAAARELMDFNLNIFPQMIAAEAFNSPQFDEKIKQLNLSLLDKYQQTLSFLHQFPKWQVSLIKGGLYLWLTYQRELSVDEYDLFLQEKLLIAPSFLFEDKYDALRINFTRIDDFAIFKERFASVNAKLSNRVHSPS
ncbi:MAG: PLP-dependent aminotransferase family protein [Streptococcaceae bacterium]|nr:PLP-dependent aminotransferase family protein [Streptococcaceae bacterium]